MTNMNANLYINMSMANIPPFLVVCHSLNQALHGNNNPLKPNLTTNTFVYKITGLPAPTDLPRVSRFQLQSQGLTGSNFYLKIFSCSC